VSVPESRGRCGVPLSKASQPRIDLRLAAQSDHVDALAIRAVEYVGYAPRRIGVARRSQRRDRLSSSFIEPLAPGAMTQSVTKCRIARICVSDRAE
jgi:hypothetical protein